ncbi:gasdermin-E-like [Genypterus blacodes]|uniref:gasdermin-E-like n=1 Tax=Genypterus blacodes TaxID=154954 RepID=UPI003F7716D6
MFATATRNFVDEVDRGGLLIPVSSLNDSIHVLSVVVKRKRVWFWQKPKYVPTDFTLNDILTGDTPITPVVNEADFIKYNGTFGDHIQGAVDANFAHASLNMEGKDASKLQTTFGSLKKEEVDVQKLLKDSENGVLDMSHCLIQQTKEKHRQVFGIVKERIVTTAPCSVIEEVQQCGQLEGLLSLCGLKTSKFSLKENGSLSKDSNVTMEIPPHTTIAYGLIELEVKRNGHYELCLMSDTYGSFEVDGALMSVSGAQPVGEDAHLKQELEQLHHHFQLLSSLPVATRSSLLQHLIAAMQDMDAISTLQDVLDHMCLGDGIKTESHINSVQAILELLDVESSFLRALHMVTSALDEMRNDCLSVLTTCCSPTVLQSLEILVLQCVLGSAELPLCSADLAPLTDEVYEKAEYLFPYLNVTLKRDGDTVKTEIIHQPSNLPLVLCIAVKGLASLARDG